MAKMKILVAGSIPVESLAKLREHFDVTAGEERYTKQEIIMMLPTYDALLVGGMKIDSEIIDAGENLCMISTSSAGFDTIDVAYAQKKGIPVANAPAGVRRATAEMAMALMLSVAKRLQEFEPKMRAGGWPKVDINKRQNVGISLYDQTLGIYGMGNIGQRVAKLANAFDMRIIYNSNNQLSPELEQQYNATFVSFDELVATADIISIHVPLFDSTYHKFSTKEFEQMQPTAYLINTARGPVVDEEALVEALNDQLIAGAGLDVFEHEPVPHKGLLAMPNVVMTPHIGTATLAARIEMADEACANLSKYLLDGIAQNIVNK